MIARTPESGISDAQLLFTQHFHAKPAGVWSAPGRANLIGEHVDYAAGICLPFALAQRTYVAVALNNRGTYRMVSDLAAAEPVEIPVDKVRPGFPSDWTGYVAGTVWAAQEQGGIDGFQLGVGLDIAIVSDVPVGGGLSSSAALECSTAIVARDLLGGSADLEALMHAAIRAENHVVGASTGGLDQRISLFAQPGHALAIDFGRGEHYQVPFDLEPHGLVILVTNTNAPHTLADGQYAARRAVIDGVTALLPKHGSLRAAHEAGVDLQPLCDHWAKVNGQDRQTVRNRVAHVTGEITRTAHAIELLKSGDMAGLGQALNDSHASLRDLYEVTVPELDLAVDVTLEHGALGARMVGGGFGGSTIALLPVSDIDATVTALHSAFATAGFNAPECGVAVASAGAHRNA